MKKQLLTAIISVGLVASAVAQGTISFSNVPSGGHVQDSPSGTPANAAAGSYSVALYWDATGAAGAGIDPSGPNASNLALVGVYHDLASDFPFAGRFNGPTLTVNGLAAGSAGIFEVVGWMGNAASYGAAPGDKGFSVLFSNPTGGSGSPPSPPSNITGWNGNMILTPVPEPTTLALGGLGAAALFLFRRRKN